MVSRYCFISLPLQDSAATTWAVLQQGMSRISFDTPTSKFHVPELRVGTLDSLLTLGDELSKINSVVEGLSRKLRRQIEELEYAAGNDNHISLTVDGVPIDSYITKFSWDETKHPLMSPLRETVNKINESVVELEEDFKARVGEYKNVENQLTAPSRKQTGSLAVRDLSDIVRDDDIVNSDHLTTLLLVIGKYSEKDWLAGYESLSAWVVPRSATKLYEKDDHVLYSVVLFRKVADKFETAAREKGFHIRKFECDHDAKLRQHEVEKRLKEDIITLRVSLQHWCYASYGVALSAWIHIIAIRLFTESVLRYGLPPAFLTAVLAPNPKSEKKIRALLDNLSNVGSHDVSFWKEDDDVEMAGLTRGDTDAHPYVSLIVNLSA